MCLSIRIAWGNAHRNFFRTLLTNLIYNDILCTQYVNVHITKGIKMGNLTVVDIAKMCNVSRTTVSRVVNNSGPVASATRRKIQKAIEENKYVPNSIARTLKTSSRTIGIISSDISNPYFNELLYGIEKTLNKKQYAVLYMNSDNKLKEEENSIQNLLSYRVNGLILLSPLADSKNPYMTLAIEKTNVVVIEGDLPGVDMVNADNYNNGKKVAEYLINKGHHQIGFCSSNYQSFSSQLRLMGYKDALKQHNISVSHDNIFIGDNYIEKIDRRLKQSEPLTAIFAVNDHHALEIYDYCYNKGLSIPSDLSVVGFDNLSVSRLINPKLTTISIPIKDIGSIAAELIISKLENRKASQLVTVDTELIERESVADLR